MTLNIERYIKRPRPASQISEVGIGGFTTFAIVKQSYRLQQQAPIVPLENGTVVSDHLIKQPITITIEGDLGRIVIFDSFAKGLIASQVPQGLGVTGAISSLFTPFQTSKIGKVVNNFQARLQDIDFLGQQGLQFNTIFGDKTGGKDIAEQFLDAIEALYYGQQLCTIDMPYRKLNNMAITGIDYERDNVTGNGTFSINAQQVMMAETEVRDISSFYKNPAKDVKNITATPQDKAVQAGEPVSDNRRRSLLATVFGGA